MDQNGGHNRSAGPRPCCCALTSLLLLLLPSFSKAHWSKAEGGEGYANLDDETVHRQIKLDGIFVGGGFAAGPTTGVLDPGTPYITGPAVPIDGIAESFGGRRNSFAGGYEYTIDCGEADEFPDIIVVADGKDYSIPSDELIDQEGDVCFLAVFSGDMPEAGPQWILGDVFMRRYHQDFYQGSVVEWQLRSAPDDGALSSNGAIDNEIPTLPSEQYNHKIPDLELVFSDDGALGAINNDIPTLASDHYYDQIPKFGKDFSCDVVVLLSCSKAAPDGGPGDIPCEAISPPSNPQATTCDVGLHFSVYIENVSPENILWMRLLNLTTWFNFGEARVLVDGEESPDDIEGVATDEPQVWIPPEGNVTFSDVRFVNVCEENNFTLTAAIVGHFGEGKCGDVDQRTWTLLTPTAPTVSCADNPCRKFTFVNAQQEEVRKTCRWLSNRDTGQRSSLCALYPQEANSARKRCPGVCNGFCDAAAFDEMDPQLSGCTYKPCRKCVYRNGSGQRKRKTCRWLAMRDPGQRDNICAWLPHRENSPAKRCPGVCDVACQGPIL